MPKMVEEKKKLPVSRQLLSLGGAEKRFPAGREH